VRERALDGVTLAPIRRAIARGRNTWPPPTTPSGRLLLFRLIASQHRKWRALSDDPELSAYLEIDRRFGPFVRYEPELELRPLMLAAGF
jgi:hypothetical protein